MGEQQCCGFWFWLYLFIVAALVLFAGIMSGLTLGLMSLGLVDLEVLMKSGSPQDQMYAAKILPVVKNQHLLLCTLLLGNALAMEALPIFLDSLVNPWGAVLISVTMILMFGEVFPQAICSRYGLAVGATMTPVVRVLVILFFPITYPISKLLDYLLGKGHVALFRRAELMTLVHMHGNEAGKGGELTHDETTIITGALELTQKTAKDAMTPIASTFCIDVNANLDIKTMQLIMSENHSRIPVYMGKPTNVIGLILVKNLLATHPEDNMPLKQSTTIRKLPRVEENMPLYDILNEFQKGHSHMAAVVKHSKENEKASNKSRAGIGFGERRLSSLRQARVGQVALALKAAGTSRALAVNISEDGDSDHAGNVVLLKRNRISLSEIEGQVAKESVSHRGKRRECIGQNDLLDVNKESLSSYLDEEVVGIITMEDVIEELLQEEILDEFDEYIDIHERIKVNLLPLAGERLPTTQHSTSLPIMSVSSLPKASSLPEAPVASLSSMLNLTTAGAGITTLQQPCQALVSPPAVGVPHIKAESQPSIVLHSLQSYVEDTIDRPKRGIINH